VNNLDPNSSQSCLNQNRIFINLDARIDLKNDKKEQNFSADVLHNSNTGNMYAQSCLTTIPYSKKQNGNFACAQESLEV